MCTASIPVMIPRACDDQAISCPFPADDPVVIEKPWKQYYAKLKLAVAVRVSGIRCPVEGFDATAGAFDSPSLDAEVSDLFNALMSKLPDDRRRDVILLKLQRCGWSRGPSDATVSNPRTLLMEDRH
jgi:hypothetical protein